MRFANILAGARGSKITYGHTKEMADSWLVDKVYIYVLRGGIVSDEHIVCFFGPDEVIKIEL